MPSRLDYKKLATQGFEFSTPNRICIWVHPLWSKFDLGQNIPNEWERWIREISKDENFALIMTNIQHYKGHSESQLRWRGRIGPIIELAQKLFKRRFVKWPVGYVGDFHFNAIMKEFGIEPIKKDGRILSNGNRPILFFDARIDGLYRSECVDTQAKRISPLLLKESKLWELNLDRTDSLNVQVGTGY